MEKLKKNPEKNNSKNPKKKKQLYYRRKKRREMAKNRRSAFVEVEMSEEDIFLKKRKEKSKRCFQVAISIGVIAIMAYFTHSVVSLSSQKPLNGDHDKELPNKQNSDKKLKTLQITGERGNKYNMFRSYIRGGEYFTQGFKHIKDKTFLESAGLRKQSKIHYIQVSLKQDTSELLTTVKMENEKNLDDELFAEGCDVFKDKDGKEVIYQLTWQKRVILKYDMDLKEIGRLELPKEIIEGWGIAVDEKDPEIAYVSDGTANIFKVNTATYITDKNGKKKQIFKILEKIEITDKNNKPVKRLNELEYVNGYLYSNVWLANRILKIDLNQGKIVKDYDMTYIVNAADAFNVANRNRRLNYGECLNGIAYDKKYKIFYLTGKNWPLIFEVEFL